MRNSVKLSGYVNFKGPAKAAGLVREQVFKLKSAEPSCLGKGGPEAGISFKLKMLRRTLILFICACACWPSFGGVQEPGVGGNGKL